MPAMGHPDRESSDDVVAAKRLTGRNLATAWSLAFVALAGFVAIGLTDLVCPSSRSESIAGPAAPSSREPAPPS
jgi:hypothetical protein